EARGGAVGLVGTIFLLGTALSLFMSIERAFNDIWHVPMSRPLHRRLTTFYAVITLTPALIGVGSVFAEKLKSQLDTWSFGLSIGAGAVSFALTVLGLTLMYKLLPHTHVKWKVATAGGVWAAVTLQIGRSLFNYYAGSIYSGSVQSKIYGAFSLIPVFFLWVYLTWALVLGGNILAYMVQNRESLTRALLRRRRRQSGAPAPPNGYLVTRVFFLIARHFRRRGGGLDPATLAADLQIEADEVVPALRLLREGGLVLEVVGNGGELVPARPLDDIRLAEFYALCDDDGYAPGELPVRGFETVEACLTQAEAARDASLQVTVEALLDEAGVGRAPVSTPPEPVIDD
ncbi:MAG: YihY family inner membrane protein, partial [Myxococcales bacterium]|nr:YihY family inner membrane protein [Myxococcales bacterium]